MREIVIAFVVLLAGCQVKSQAPKIDFKYLLKDKILSNYFYQNENGLEIYTDTNSNQVDYFIPNEFFEIEDKTIFSNISDSVLNSLLKPGVIQPNHWNSIELSDFKINRKNLQGVKVALDPGHVALDIDMAIIEGKYLIIGSDSLFEADLTLKTAYFLKELLEKEGAEVFVTRDSIGYVKNGLVFEDWLQNDFQKSLDSLLLIQEIDSNTYEDLITYNKSNSLYGQKVVFHKVFKHLDTKHRARLINEYKPDITVVIHYNVDEKNDPWNTYTDKNYSMMFVPGSFCDGELSKTEQRLSFARLLLSDSFQKSVDLSKSVANTVSISLKIPLAKTTDADYLMKYSEEISPGVFARNLALTRLIHSPLCYAEALYQENKIEFKLLINDDRRLKEVANAYFTGIQNYYAK